ncbi:hypothetical protein NHP190003_04570 [Helicobacter sp. NHP19-003]|uniref:DUF493 domain-containing protein n=1 Tax=Helicobacter gastrocanis TaxID=2849641 RepID=A0ABM7S9F9_9HELI|nr:DUF493 domain-containing protein [Helicobacter sp. NHP19-003]BCZ17175.1 hypothetical protein NHP190003_04570 [Helicobacter sp. NHP19-003]
MDSKNAITYPCLWEYRLITDKPQELLNELAGLLAPLKYQVCTKNKSAQGKYTSLQLSLVVASEQEQHAIFAKLSNHAFVKWVL